MTWFIAAGRLTGTSASAAGRSGPSGPNLGVNVTVFDPSTPVSQIQATLDAANAKQVDNEMGTDRYAFLFKPGTYGTAEHPLQIKVGYYTEVSGLGAAPTDVVINGKVEVYNRCLADGGTSNCPALVNPAVPWHQPRPRRPGPNGSGPPPAPGGEHA